MGNKYKSLFAGILTCTSHSWRIFLSSEESLLTGAENSPFSIAETMRRALWTPDVTSVCLVEAWVACWGWQKYDRYDMRAKPGRVMGTQVKISHANIRYPHNVSQSRRTQGNTYCLLIRNQHCNNVSKILMNLALSVAKHLWYLSEINSSKHVRLLTDLWKSGFLLKYGNL